MIPVFVYSLCQLTFGTLYPSYSSYKAIKNKDVREYSRWMMYWVCFGIYSAAEVFTDFFIGFWLPFYYELKIIFILWLTSPYGNGARIMYKNVIHPQLNRREEVIDSYIVTAKEIGVTSCMSFVRKFSDIFNNAARHVFHAVQIAIVTHLQNTNQLSSGSFIPSLLSVNSATSQEKVVLFDDTSDRTIICETDSHQRTIVNEDISLQSLSSTQRTFSMEVIDGLNFGSRDDLDSFELLANEEPTPAMEVEEQKPKKTKKARKDTSTSTQSVATRRSARRAAANRPTYAEDVDIDEID